MIARSFEFWYPRPSRNFWVKRGGAYAACAAFRIAAVFLKDVRRRSEGS